MKGDRWAILWSPPAAQDLLDIWEYVAVAASPAAADRRLHEIDRACFALGGWPQFGKARDDVRKGLRPTHIGRYVLFYRLTEDAIEVVRVLDERRDVEKIFCEDE